MKRLLVFGLALALFQVSTPSRAQDALGIAAVVNNKVISAYDLGMRLSLVMVFSGLPDTIETRNRMGPQVLQTLVEDELKRQEAARLKIIASEKEIQSTITTLEKDNRMKKGGLKTYLSRRGIEISILSKKIKADLVWRKLINIRYSPTVIINDEEIEEVVAEMKKNEGKPEYQAAEIFLPVNNEDEEQKTLEQINRLVQQIRSGANFQSLARNFSKNPSAERGGALGWTRPGQLSPEYDNALARMKPGQVSSPIRTPDGYALLLLMKQRTAQALGRPSADSAVVNLQQLFLPIPKGASPAVVNDAMEGAKIASEKTKSCAALDNIAKKLGSPLSGNLGDIKTSALAPQQRSMIRGLPPLKASRPVRTADGVIVLMVCRRDEPKTPELTEEDLKESIARRLTGERLSILARQYLRDIRRNAFVDVRL